MCFGAVSYGTAAVSLAPTGNKLTGAMHASMQFNVHDLNVPRSSLSAALAGLMLYRGDACSHGGIGVAHMLVAVPEHGLDLVQQLFGCAVCCCHHALLQGLGPHQIQPCVHLIAAEVPATLQIGSRLSRMLSCKLAQEQISQACSQKIAEIDSTHVLYTELPCEVRPARHSSSAGAYAWN